MLAFRGALFTAVVLLATACSGGARDEGTTSRGEVVPATAAPDPPATQPPAAAPEPSTTSTTAPPPPPPWSIGPVPDKGLGPGDRGPQVRAVEERLTAFEFDVTVTDEVFDQNTGYRPEPRPEVGRQGGGSSPDSQLLTAWANCTRVNGAT